jgi:hypothetical protein
MVKSIYKQSNLDLNGSFVQIIIQIIVFIPLLRLYKFTYSNN